MEFSIGYFSFSNIHFSETTVFSENQKSTIDENSIDENSSVLLPNQLKTYFNQTLDSYKRFEETSIEIIKQLEIQCPQETAKFKAIKTTYFTMIEEMQTLGWKGLKNKYGPAMKQTRTEEGISFEGLRKLIVDATITLSLAAVQQMGYTEPGSHAAIGTPGYASDIDTVYIPGKEVPQEVQALEKLIFDAIVLGHLDSLSGRLIDTESYIGQKGGNFAIEKFMQSESSKQHYSFLELTLAMTQFYEAKIGFHGSKRENSWELFKEEQLQQAEFYSSDYKSNIDHILTDVECFKNQVTFEIEELAVKQYYSKEQIPSKCSVDYPDSIQKLAQNLNIKDPEILKKTAISYRASALIGLSVAMDEDLNQLQELDKQLKVNQERKFILNKFKNAPSEEVENIQKTLEDIAKQIETVRINFSTKGGLRNLCFDEGYIAYGPLIVVTAKAGGQSSQRVLDRVQSDACIRFERQDSTHSLILNAEQKELPTPQELLISQQENLGFYQKHFIHDQTEHTDEAVKKSFVKNSKYLDRIYSNNLELLKELDQMTQSSNAPNERLIEFQLLNNQIKHLQQQVEQYAYQASEIEKCKRRTELNETSAIKFLTSEFQKIVKKNDNVNYFQKENIEELVKSIVQTFQDPFIFANKDFASSLENLPDSSIEGLIKSTSQIFIDSPSPTPSPSPQEKKMRVNRFMTESVKKSFDHRERYNILISKIIGYGYCSVINASPCIKTNNPHIDLIMKALAGFPIVIKQKNNDNTEVEIINKELNELFNDSEKITLEIFNLNSRDAIEHFNIKMSQISDQIRNLCYLVGLVANPAPKLPVENLQATWQKALLKNHQ